MQSWRRAAVLVAIALVVVAAYASLAEADDGTPQIPHGISGQEQCLACHSAEGITPVPPSHITFDENSCLGCHLSSAAIAGESDCLSCHGRPGMSMTLENGERLSLYVDPEVIAASIHGNKLLCTDCHSSDSAYHRTEWNIPSLLAYSVAQY